MPDDATRLWFHSALLPQGWARGVRLTLAAGVIVGVDTETEPAAGDERHFAALPGLPNLHSHAFQRGMAGLAERRGPGSDNFWSWREAMYRFLDRVDPDDCEAIAAQLYMEMLEAGFTRVGEFHYLHHDRDGAAYANIAEMAERIAGAAAATGIGLTLLPVFYAHANFGDLPPNPGQRRFITDLDRFGRLMEASRAIVASMDGAVIGAAPHSLRAATLPEVEAVASLAGAGPVHIHAAEQIREVEDCIAWCGRRPVELLLEAGAGRSWCLIHATHITEAETLELAASGAVAGLCPVTEANLGDGVFPSLPFTGAGGGFGIGSDSNIIIDAAQELRQLEYAQRLSLRARNILAAGEGRSTGRSLFDGARAGGAQALGAPEHGLEAGAPADIVGLNAADPAFVAREADDLLDAWIFASRGDGVDCVWRAGRRLVSGGRHHGRTEIEPRFRAVMRRVLA